jgi:CheY-like chemotaxis protein
MKLSCVLCSKEYVFDPNKVPEQGFRVNCGSCGAKYSVHLPEGWRNVLALSQHEAEADPEASADDRYILIADDTAFFRALMTDVLGKHGYNVKSAADGKQALETIQAAPASFKLVLLDLQMPILSGFGVLEELKKMGDESPPVIVMTGVHDSHDDIKIVREMGAAGFLDKSLDPSVAVERIQMVLEQQESSN